MNRFKEGFFVGLIKKKGARSFWGKETVYTTNIMHYIAFYITSSIRARGLKLEVIYRAKQQNCKTIMASRYTALCCSA